MEYIKNLNNLKCTAGHTLNLKEIKTISLQFCEGMMFVLFECPECGTTLTLIDNEIKEVLKAQKIESLIIRKAKTEF